MLSFSDECAEVLSLSWTATNLEGIHLESGNLFIWTGALRYFDVKHKKYGSKLRIN